MFRWNNSDPRAPTSGCAKGRPTLPLPSPTPFHSARLRPHVDWLRENDPENTPTFFDATTAAALLIFAEADLDCAILEVGLGGRLDSTNIVTPQVSCITSIELEHTDKLGNTLAEIAAEKDSTILFRLPIDLFTPHLAPPRS